MYLAVLGRQRDLALAELESAGAEPKAFGDCALISTNPGQSRLGGSIKLARIIDGPKSWPGWAKLTVPIERLPEGAGKTVFGVSFYGPPKLRGGARAFTLNLKKLLPKNGSVRAVTAASPLSAAQLKFNQILKKGFELIIGLDGERMVLALTESFQDIDWYSKRDYGRPSRSAKVGMLPPKLAQIMINLAQAEKVYDPFCGTGVVLQEALLMGKNAAGSDIDPAMVGGTQKNLAWLKDQPNQPLPKYSVTQGDARSVALPSGYSVVTEGYLGLPLSSAPKSDQLQSLKAELNELYSACLKSWHGQLEAGRRLCLAIPCWQTGTQTETLPLIDQIEGLGYNLVRFQSADSRRLIYAREGQIVGRQLLILTRN